MREKTGLLLGLIFNGHPKIFKFIPDNTQFPKGSIRNVKRGGIHYQLDISDYQEWLIYFRCKSDSSLYILDYLDQAQSILDVGANIGQTALNIRKNQLKKGIVPAIYAFEPFPDTFEKLSRNVEKNNAQKEIHCISLGVGSAAGVLPMIKHSEANSGGYRISPVQVRDSINIQVVTIDAFVEQQNIQKLDFIKIDVEGFEMEVLKGAKKTIQQFRPVLFFEYSVENILAQNGNIEEALNQILDNNYKISTKEGLSDLKSILSLKDQTDLICTPI